MIAFSQCLPGEGVANQGGASRHNDHQGNNAMSSIIDFLERLGADAQLRHASQEELALVVADSQLDAAVGAAIIAKSTAELYALLDMRPMFHIQNNPGREEEEEEEEGDEEQEAPAPSKQIVFTDTPFARRASVALD
jgi:hypothetical protein